MRADFDALTPVEPEGLERVEGGEADSGGDYGGGDGITSDRNPGSRVQGRRGIYSPENGEGNLRGGEA